MAPAPSGIGRDLTAAAPGHVAIAACLRAQASEPPRNPAAALLGVSPLRARARPWFQEATSAEAVADVLARLGPEWVVLHDVPIGAATLSHLAVGPTGVFAIESRRHRGANVLVDRCDLLVSGARRPDLDEVALASALATENLEAALGRSVPVQPLLVVLDAASMSASSECDVRVVSPGRLLGILVGAHGRLSVRDQDAIALVAADAETWGAQRSVVTDTADAWASLRRGVERSRVRSGRWLVVALAASALAVSTMSALLIADGIRLVLP